MRKIRKILAVACLLFTVLMQSSVIAFAQQATDSGNLSIAPTHIPSPTPSPSTLQYATSSATIINSQPVDTTQNPFTDLWLPSGATTQVTQPSLSLFTNASQNSAGVVQPPSVGKLSKHTFKQEETVSLSVGNQQASDITVVVTNPVGNQIDPNAVEKITTNGTQTTVAIDPSRFQFIPGKYTIAITDNTGKTTTQDFTWGVLVLNTNKSLYLPQETSDISIGVLDDKGATICDATVNLSITSPSGTVTQFSTTNNTIVVTNQCHSHDMSLTPDYEVHFQVGGIGDYAISLSATTKNGTNTISDTIHVVNAVPFDVERVSATRLYPYNTYPMIFHITANQDFSGSIVETAPANFQISPFASQSAQTFDATTLVMPIPNMLSEFGVASVTLNLPFSGNYKMVQGFGVALTDPIEEAYYSQFGLAGHDGLDFAMPDGTAVVAADDGKISFAGDGAYGTMVVIDHVWGRSYYGHLSSFSVKNGDSITRGQQIGLSGHSGHVTGSHLHFGVKPARPDMRNGFYGKVDPTPYLAAISGNSQVLGIATANISTTEKIITWNTTIKKGQSIDIAYNYQSPPQSPAFYTLGPLKFIDNSKTTVFQENRQWELAIDANSTSTKNCTVTANDAATGTITWGTVGTNVGACANAGTTVTGNLASSAISEYLKTTGFGFSIPTNSNIVGIQFTINRNCSNATSMRKCVDNKVFLYKAGTVQSSGTNQAQSGSWPTTSTAITYGSSTSISWGGTWLYSDINNSGFGIGLSVSGGSSTSTTTGTVTGIITATITYDSPPNPPSLDSPISTDTPSPSNTVFKMTATDPESDNIQYELLVYKAATCTGGTTIDSLSAAGGNWSGLNATCVSGTDCYTSGTQGVYTATNLAASTQYSWTAKSKDFGGNATGVSVASASCTTFTTTVAGPTLDQLLRHGDWFNNGVRKFFTF